MPFASSTASTSSLPHVEIHDSDKISAYYSLAFPNFTYYLQTLTVTIGRRPILNHSTTATTSTPSDVTLVDVDLGPLKSVSRLHARIEYEEEEERFILVVLGRNGAWVDGIWAGCGSKVPLGARSQIQIATRTFHFILPPPQEPELASPSPPPSTVRQRSPSLDITSLSPASSHLPSPQPTVPAPIGSHIPFTTSKLPKSAKKRKRSEPNPLPPDKMPPKPLATYAVMCYRAITSLGGKATLQDVIQWMIDNYEWYRLNVGGPWENSIRHNLSSNRAFRNVARSPDERGKGFLWGIDPMSEQGLQDQDAKARQAELDRQQGQIHTTTVAASGISTPKVQPPPVKPAFTMEPLNKSVKEKDVTDRKPALLKMPKPPPAKGKSTKHTVTASSVTSMPPVPAPTNAYMTVPATTTTSTAPSSLLPDTPATISTPSSTSLPSSSGVPHLPSNVTLPIIVAPLPDSHPASSASAAALASASPASALLAAPPIVLHSGTLILNPTIFAHLTTERLRELEGLGAQKALEILQGHIVRFLKEKMRSDGGVRGRGRGRGRGRASKIGGKEGRTELSKPGAEATGTVQPAMKHEEQQCAGAASSTTEGSKPSVQSLSRNLANEHPHTNGVDGTIDERVMKKRKMDTNNLDVDVDIDVIGP